MMTEEESSQSLKEDFQKSFLNEVDLMYSLNESGKMQCTSEGY